MKAPNGRGSVYQDRDGRWRAVLSVPGPDGRRRRVKATGHTRKEALSALDDLRRRHGQGAHLGTRPTVRQFLDEWMPLHRSRVRPQTADRDERTRRLHFGAIESVRIDELTFSVIDRWLASLEVAGVGARSRQMARVLLGTALQEAMRQGLVVRNEARLSSPVKVPAPDPKWLSPDQARRLLVAARGERFGLGIALGLYLGLRRAEILGLSVGDIDIERRTIYVHRALTKHSDPTGGKYLLSLGETKTRRSRRRLSIPDPLVEWLRPHVGADPEAPLIVNSAGGRPDPDVFSHAVRRIGRQAGLSGVHAHLLRHTTATLLADSGVGIDVISDLLGHGDPALTARLYSHVLDRARRDSLDVLAGVLGAAVAPGWLPELSGETTAVAV